MDFDPLNPHFNPAKAAAGDTYPFDTAVTGLVDPDPKKLIDFAPVPRLRQRRNGWTDLTQRCFILALAELGCVAHAARAVGKTPRSAYRLLDADGAEGFAQAWDHALAFGIERLRTDAFDRAFNGAMVPVYRRGRLVRTEHRRCERLTIALLSGRSQCAADRREQASSRRILRRKLKAVHARQAEEQRRADALAAQHQAILDRIEFERLGLAPRSPRSQPRVRIL